MSNNIYISTKRFFVRKHRKTVDYQSQGAPCSSKKKRKKEKQNKTKQQYNKGNTND